MRLSMIAVGQTVKCFGRLAEVIKQNEQEVKVLCEGQTQYWSPGAEVEIATKVEEPVAEKPADEEPAAEKQTAKRHDLFGFPVTAVLRWMGKDGWSWEAALRVIRDLKCDCAEATVKIQVKAGSKGERGEPAKLTNEQIDQLRSLDVQLEPKTSKKPAKKAIEKEIGSTIQKAIKGAGDRAKGKKVTPKQDVKAARKRVWVQIKKLLKKGAK